MRLGQYLVQWFSELPLVSFREMLSVACVAGLAIFLTGLVASHFIEGSGLKTLFASPVVDRGCRVISIIITLTDFFRHARADSFRGMGGGLRRLLRRTPEVTSGKPEVAGQIMTTAVVTAHENSHITELVPILTERRLHRIPIVDARNKLVGLVTQTDLIAALYRHLAAIAVSKPGNQAS